LVRKAAGNRSFQEEGPYPEAVLKFSLKIVLEAVNWTVPRLSSSRISEHSEEHLVIVRNGSSIHPAL
jgi:hypothetical protein